jgi:hypothetical protein
MPTTPRFTLPSLSQLLFASIAYLGMALLAPATTSAAPQVRLSGDWTQAESAIRDHPSDKPLALLLEDSPISASDTESLLHAIGDRRGNGGVTVAIVDSLSDGLTIAALACDALVTLPGARLTGATDDWCTSPSRREDLVSTLQRLGRLPEPLARRLVSTNGTLSWDKTAGFQASNVGSLLLAQDGATLELSAAQLEQTSLAARAFKDPSAATAAVEGRIVRARSAVPSVVGAPGGVGPSGIPSNSAPVPGGATLPGAAPTQPASSVDMAKLAPKLKDYHEQLMDVKAKIAEFDRYYRGTSGVWTSSHRSLRAVWQSKTEMTKDKDTKLRCSRLQQDIREGITKLETTTRSIEKICDDKRHPDVVRTTANLENLKQFREAIQRNEVDDYDKYKPLVDRAS